MSQALSSGESITVTATRAHRWWRVPRARLLINGAEHPETRLVSFSTDRTRYARSDTAQVSLAVDRSALAKLSRPYWFDPASPTDGSALADIEVAIEMRDEAVSGAQWEQVFAGIVDAVNWGPDQTTLDIECRDYLAKLLDLRVQDSWMNKTGVELITTMIEAAGLTADVSFPAGMTGQFWQIEHKRTSGSSHHRFQTAYDLARHIADIAGCDLYADGRTIICAPYPVPGSASAPTTHHIHYSDPGPLTSASGGPITVGGTGLRLRRNFQVAKGVVVHAVSWDSRQRIKAQCFFSALGKSPTAADSNGTLYTLRLPPNMPQADVEARAQDYYQKIVAHDRTVTIEIPGRIGLAPRHFGVIAGTNSTFDVSDSAPYTIDAVQTQYSLDQMFTQNMTMRSREASDGSNTDGGDDD
ncbi:hypothetical protein [Tanticharoenia sakaeratensis]|uniref:Uncharacterized protein n=1 Tax=Tanticharoenia sakaeratensis NBRC 103193 TaxID=1231623 RepID=A0A0D6MNN4_9PROT|nr:hypothetical protein [Tanticharoenia sakaeratensis]GAN55274.1 hypothetical protein Tasa_041_069 [Tanticharoenia sakaeratensis NBRC 103193]GBQ23417.1 hypothetical protein AA103193_2411 [Tanticharoenia sakaeratensis NBRC 103193]